MNSHNIDETNEINFVLHDLQYSSVLNVPFHIRVLHQLFEFFGKINTSISAPAFLGYFYYIIIIIQSFLPSFLIDCQDLWPKKSFISMILYVLCYFYQGPHFLIKSYRVIVSLIISIIFIIMIIFLIFRARHYQKAGRVSSIEIKFFYYTFKYIMPLLCPHIISGVTISFDQIIIQNQFHYNILCIIFSIITLALYLYFNYAVICPRVLLEDTPSHEWIPYLSVLSILNTILLSMISGIAGCIDGKKRVACSICMLLISALLGTLFFITNGMIKMTSNVVSSATFFGSAFTSLFITITLLMSKSIAPEIIFIISVVVYIILNIVLKIVKNNKTVKILLYFDSLMDSENLANQMLSEKYDSSFIFLCDIRSAIEMWHPYFANFEIFEFATSKWPEKFDVLLFYSRILTIFPSQNLKMISIASRISNLPEKNIRTCYLYQFRHFSRSRQTSVTPIFREKFEKIKTHTETTNTIIKKFWEDILQNNISNFWLESDNVISNVSDLDSLYAQLLADYTSNIQLLKSYGEFVQNIKLDTEESQEIFKKIEYLKVNGTGDSDLAFIIALQVFPNLNNCLELYEKFVTSNTNNENDNNTEYEEELKETENENESNEKNESDIQFDILFSDIIKHSKLGSIWIECIILVVVTIISIVLFYWFYNSYINEFSIKQDVSIKLLIQFNMLLNDLSNFVVNMNIYPIVLENQTETQISILNGSEFTEQISPILYENEKIPEFSLDRDKMLKHLSNVKYKFTQTIDSLSTLNKKEKMIQEINYLFYNDKNYSISFNELFNKQLILAQELLKKTTTTEFFRDNDYYNDFVENNFILFEQINSLSSLSRDYCSKSYESSLKSLNLKMLITLLITLFLLTLPYLIQSLILTNQFDEIAKSFTLFPKTEIRSIINKFGESSSNIEEVEQTNIISNVNNKNKIDSIIFILLYIASIICILICSLIIYFTANGFIKNAENVSNEIYSLVAPFASLSQSFSQMFRFYMLTHDGTNEYNSNIQYLDRNVYYSGNDNFSEILGNIETTLNATKSQLSTGLYGLNGSLGIFYNHQNQIFDYFEEDFISNETQGIAPSKTFFEQLATCVFIEAINHVTDFLSSYFFEANYVYEYSLKYPYTISQLGVKINEMPSLIYWFSEFVEESRTKPYFKLVEDDALNKISNYKVVGDSCFCIVIVWQILTCICMILYLISRNINIRQVLYFYNFFKPEIIIQNQEVLNLIETGKSITNSMNNNEMFNHESIFNKISQGVIIVTNEFKIINFNNSFIELFHLTDDCNIIGKNLLVDIIPENSQNKSWDQLIYHTKNALIGKYKTNFNENINITLDNGEELHFNCMVLFMTDSSVANEREINRIEKIALIFDENTEIFMKKLQIDKENKHLNKILSNTMPSKIVSNFMNSNECISFIVQSVSIGSIRVKVNKQFDENSTDDFISYNQIFKCFDDEIKQFDLLSKLTVFSHTYTFIGGLFSEINKPERHAEESIKFALNLLNLVPEISNKIGSEIQLTIGVHTGGPIVAGVINFDKPTFQIIGTVSEMANQMKNKGSPQTICVSRSVYELIFSSGFKIHEQGDTQIKGGKVIPTYLISP